MPLPVRKLALAFFLALTVQGTSTATVWANGEHPPGGVAALGTTFWWIAGAALLVSGLFFLLFVLRWRHTSRSEGKGRVPPRKKKKKRGIR